MERMRSVESRWCGSGQEVYDHCVFGGDVKNVKSFRIVTEGGRSYEFGKELLYPVQQNSGDYFLFLPDGNFAIVPEKEAKIKLKQDG